MRSASSRAWRGRVEHLELGFGDAVTEHEVERVAPHHPDDADGSCAELLEPLLEEDLRDVAHPNGR
jgi:hypothetical protein